jgi:hypothetical protein
MFVEKGTTLRKQETFVSKILPDGEVLAGELYPYNTDRLIRRKLMPSILLD